MKERLIGFLKTYVLFICIFVLQKPFFILYYQSLYPDISWTDWFSVICKLAPAKLKIAYKVREDKERYFVDITLKNTSSRIAFFNQLQFLNSKMSPIRPSFYSDNFFSLIPGEKKTVTIDTAKEKLDKGVVLVLKGWNTDTQKYKLK